MERSTVAAEHPVLAMVALNSASLDGTKVVERLRARFGDDIVSAPCTSGNGVVQFTLEGRACVYLTPIPLPIQWADLEGPCRNAEAGPGRWPTASEVMRAHRQHVLVVLADAPPKIVRQRIGLTHVVAAVAATTDAVGIYWTEGRVVHDAATFIAAAKDASLDAIPYRLWIDLRVTDGSKPDTISVATQGLPALGHREIEVVDSALPSHVVIAKIRSLIDHLLDQGTTPKDGETFSTTDNDRIRVQVTADGVLRLEI
ncbi:MAG: DUF4261 domain-containing protein [Polyangiales bacterium]